MMTSNFSQLLSLVSKTGFNTIKTNFKGFFCSPQQIDGVSVITKLKNIIGIDVNGKKTLKTPYIFTGQTTTYNGFQLSLKSDNENVYLIINVLDTDVVSGNWTIKELMENINQKNDTHLTPDMVVELIESGRMGVKFNVSVLKDHGTRWIIQKTDDTKKKESPTTIEDDFFKDL